MKLEKITVGLIKGRHDMPVSDYIFEKVEDMFDYDAISNRITHFISRKVGLSYNEGGGIYSCKGEKALVVYVTGLTAVSCELVDVCNKLGVPLTLMHYDRDTGEYRAQVLSTAESVWY